jgi:hypothetical protein
MYICNSWYMLYILVNCWQVWVEWSSISARPADSQLRRTAYTNCCIYTLLPPDDGQQASTKHVEL